MLVKECAFCEAPVIRVDDFGFCDVCSRALDVLTADEIEAVKNKVGFKKQTPDKEFCRAS